MMGRKTTSCVEVDDIPVYGVDPESIMLASEGEPVWTPETYERNVSRVSVYRAAQDDVERWAPLGRNIRGTIKVYHLREHPWLCPILAEAKRLKALDRALQRRARRMRMAS